MTEFQLAAERWLEKNQRDMIECPNQPGKLMISKMACSKRYRIGRREDYHDLMKGDLFNYAYKRGLSVCRECSIGKRIAATQPVSHSDSRPRHQHFYSSRRKQAHSLSV